MVISCAWLGFIFSSFGGDTTRLIPVLGTYSFGIIKLLPNIQQVFAGWASYKFKYSSLEKFVLATEKINIEVSNKKINPNPIKFEEYIQFKNVSFSYGLANKSPYILENINLQINKGEHLGIIGAPGSGKSTLLDLIMGLIEPSKGELFIDSENFFLSSIRLEINIFNSGPVKTPGK